MSLDLLNELEKRVQSAVDTIDTLKDEVEQLKLENAQLQEEKSAWEARLSGLLGKFSLLDSASSEAVEADEVESLEADAPQVEDELEADDALAAEDDDAPMLADESVAEAQLVEEDLTDLDELMDLDELEAATAPTSPGFTAPKF